MKFLYQDSHMTTIKREEDELLASSLFLSSDYEITAMLRVDVRSFRVKRACLDTYRSPGNCLNGGKDLPQLVGFEAYFNEGRELLRAVGNEGNGVPRDLFNECVNGIIQAETYLLEERGFPSPRAYEEFWEKSYATSCRYYAHVARATYTWYEYLGHTQRRGNLFNRYKSCAVYQKRDGDLVAQGSFSDSFHELGLSAQLRRDGVIADISGNFIRTRDPVCLEVEQRLASLKGKPVTELGKRDIREMLGGAEGCVHLADIANDLRKAIAAALKRPH
jgi:hypothetical protein